MPTPPHSLHSGQAVNGGAMVRRPIMGLSVDLHVRESPIYGALLCSPVSLDLGGLHIPTNFWGKPSPPRKGG